MKKPKSYHQVFMDRTRAAYNKMQERLAPKYRKNPRGGAPILVRPGRTVPFTLEHYRDWVKQQLGGSEEGSGECSYCLTWITAGDLVPDHMTPLARGGSPGLENLAGCCAPCNNRKGKMSVEGYLYLRKCAERLSPADATDMWQRLESAVQLAAQKNWSKREKPTKEKPADVRPDGNESETF